MRTRWRFWKSAQGLVEFALVLPIALLLLLGTIEYGRLFHAWVLVTNAAQEGARYAASGEWIQSFCTDMDLPGDADGDGDADRGLGYACLINNQDPEFNEIDAARLPSIKHVVDNLTQGLAKDPTAGWKQPKYFKVTVCANPGGVYHPPSDTSPPRCLPNETAGRLDAPYETRVLVAVTYEFEFITPFIRDIAPTVTLHAEREAILERFRVQGQIDLPPTIALPSPTPLPSATYTPSPTFTHTPTNTPSPTPTATPTPSCDLIRVDGAYVYSWNAGRVYAFVDNHNTFPITLVQTTVNWDASVLSGAYVDKFVFNGSRYYNGDDASPPASASGSVTLPKLRTDASWYAEFRRGGRRVSPGEMMLSPFTVDLQFRIESSPALTCSYTVTYEPFHLEIVQPPADNVVVLRNGTNAEREQTRFEAEAWDPNVGTDNGDGVSWVQFRILRPSGGSIYWKKESVPRFCTFGGDATCNWMYNWMWNRFGNRYPNGVYTLQARARRSSDGGVTAWRSRTFILDKPAPSCSDLVVTTHLQARKYAQLEMYVRNTSPKWRAPFELTYTRLDWNPVGSGYYVDEFKWQNTRYYSGNDYSSPTEVNSGRGLLLPRNVTRRWRVDFDRPGDDDPLYGTFTVLLRFQAFDAQGNVIQTCDIVESLTLNTPAPTPTPTLTLTPTITPTPSITPTPTITLTPTITPTSTITPTATVTPTVTRTPTPSPSPTVTRTPTITPTPDCSQISISSFRVSGDDLVAQVHNGNPIPVTLTHTRLEWPDVDAISSARVDWMKWNGSKYYYGDDYSSPTTTNSSLPFASGANVEWRADFDGVSSLFGEFTLELTFDGVCVTYATLVIPTPTPTRTPTITPTPTLTFTPTPTPPVTPTFTPTPPSVPTVTPTPTYRFGGSE